MNENVKAQLQKDEKVIWMGKAQPFGLMNSENRSGMLLQWALAGGLAVILTVVYLIVAEAIFIPLPLVLIFIAAMIILLPIMLRVCIMNCDYIITNRRVMVMTDARVGVAMPLEEMKKNYVVFEEVDGGYSLAMGGATSVPSKERRKKVDDGVQNSDGENIGVLFYNMSKDECDKAVAALGGSPLL